MEFSHQNLPLERSSSLVFTYDRSFAQRTAELVLREVHDAFARSLPFLRSENPALVAEVEARLWAACTNLSCEWFYYFGVFSIEDMTDLREQSASGYVEFFKHVRCELMLSGSPPDTEAVDTVVRELNCQVGLHKVLRQGQGRLIELLTTIDKREGLASGSIASFPVPGVQNTAVFVLAAAVRAILSRFEDRRLMEAGNDAGGRRPGSA